jgi:beta-lactamase class A
MTLLRASKIWLALSLFLLALPAAAAPTRSPFDLRARELSKILSGDMDPNDYFAPSFLAAVPQEQVVQLSRQLIAQNGKIVGFENLLPASEVGGSVQIIYERAIVKAELAVSPSPPNRVIGLQIVAVVPRGDGPIKLEADFRSLPGRAGVLITQIDRPIAPIVAVNPSEQFAIGSEFKLWILAEAARQVASKERRWTDVIPLGAPSLPSGITQSWPRGAPMTLHSLATLMISISDNSAADTLLHALGRTKVNAIVRTVGHAQPERTLPILSTIEAFTLKMKASADLRQALSRGGVDTKAQLLDASASRLSLAEMDNRELAEGPRFIDTIEWFASPVDVANSLNWIRTNGGKEALDILAINRPLGRADNARFGYVGYKGGSETGVIAMSYLIKAKSGAWFVVSGSWNNQESAVDKDRFEALMIRAVSLIP